MTAVKILAWLVLLSIVVPALVIVVAVLAWSVVWYLS